MGDDKERPPWEQQGGDDRDKEKVMGDDKFIAVYYSYRAHSVVMDEEGLIPGWHPSFISDIPLPLSYHHKGKWAIMMMWK